MKKSAAVISLAVIALAAGGADAKEGFYIGLGMGGAVVDGEAIDASNNKDWIPLQQFGTDGIKSGFGMLLRFGYNVMGYGSAEVNFTAFGNDVGTKSKRNGAGLITGVGRYHPMEHFIHDYDIDPYAFFGLGYSFAGYQAGELFKPEPQSKGFRGMVIQTGLGCDYYVTRWFSAGVLLNFYFPIYDTFLYDWDKGIDYSLANTPSTFIFVPMAVGTFHFLPFTDRTAALEKSDGKEKDRK